MITENRIVLGSCASVTASLVEQAPAKINLTLRVLGRRADGYHELESLVAFADLADTLSLQPGGDAALDVTGPFAAACGPVADNLVLKALAALRERVAGLRAGRFRLEKNIPVAAGLGGGSADAAAALRLLARANGLAPDDRAAGGGGARVGADVPVCLEPRARIMRGVGDELSAAARSAAACGGAGQSGRGIGDPRRVRQVCRRCKTVRQRSPACRANARH